MSHITTYKFTESYIANLADYIEENYIRNGEKDLSRLAIVFGGKRPRLFLRRELARRTRTPFYPPRFFTIDEFISYIVRQKETYTKAGDLDNCYLLYQLAQETTPEILKGRESFAEFLPWTREILRFIDNLDLEMVENKRLLNVESNARIGYAVPEDINRLLSHIVKLKENYHARIEKNKVYPRGYEYLKAAELIDSCPLDEFDRVLFCNFFYFHKTEEKVAKSLYERGKAALIFQGDQRKWPVLERISEKFNCRIEEGDEPAELTFDLKLYQGFDTHSQVAHVREILKQGRLAGADGKRSTPPENTVIVLPDPDTLVPLISEIGTLLQDFNISMGYPLRRSSFYSLFQFVFTAQGSRKGSRYYARDYLKCLRHPFVKNLNLGADTQATRILIHKIEEILTGKAYSSLSGSLFFTLKEMESLDDVYDLTKEMCESLGSKIGKPKLKDLLAKIHDLLFRNWEGVSSFQGFALNLEYFLDTFTGKSFLKKYPLNLNIAEKMYAVKDEFQSASFAAEEFPQEEIFRIFDEKISREMVAFTGSPLKGLQVLGLFETRSLNFDNVIILDANEGVLPSLKIYEPLIPREVMISLNLDRLELEEEIQRYQFMRLISSAKNVHLVYQKSKDKERSRFLEELAWSREKKEGTLNVIRPREASFSVSVRPQETIIPKTPAMIETLKKHTFSASSINTYLRDPGEFYYQYVLGLKEPEDLLDEPEARQVGTFVHELLEESFTPFVGKRPKIDAKFQKRFVRLFEKRFDRVFGRSMKSDSFLLRSVLEERMARFLEREADTQARPVKKVVFLEKVFQDSIKLSCGTIKFKYIVDRIDEMDDGSMLIIDYKTGSVNQMPKGLDHIRDMELTRENIFENVRSFQIPLYFQFLEKEFGNKDFNAALYNLRTLELKSFLNGKNGYNKEEMNKEFTRCLDFVVSEILDPDVPFVQQ